MRALLALCATLPLSCGVANLPRPAECELVLNTKTKAFTWRDATGEPSARATKVDVSGQVGWALFPACGVVARSDDGGGTWQAVKTWPDYVPKDMKAVGTDCLWVWGASTEDGKYFVAVTHDGGRTWHRLPGCVHVLCDVRVFSERNARIIGKLLPGSMRGTEGMSLSAMPTLTFGTTDGGRTFGGRMGVCGRLDHPLPGVSPADKARFYLDRLGDMAYVLTREHDLTVSAWHTAAERLGLIGRPALPGLMRKLREATNPYERAMTLYALSLAAQKRNVKKTTNGELPPKLFQTPSAGEKYETLKTGWLAWWSKHGSTLVEHGAEPEGGRR